MCGDSSHGLTNWCRMVEAFVVRSKSDASPHLHKQRPGYRMVQIMVSIEILDHVLPGISPPALHSIVVWDKP